MHRARCDVSDFLSVRAAMLSLTGDGCSPNGIFHAAHALADAALANQTAANFANAFAPKVHGASALHLSALRAPLDFFSLYSSVAGLLGSAGQAPHSAANTRPDSISGQRQRLGLRAQSVAWAPLPRSAMQHVMEPTDEQKRLA